MNKNSVIEIYSGTMWEAEMVKSLLQVAQIECFLKNTTLNSYAFEPIKAEGVKVMIEKSDYINAKEIVDSFNNSK